MIGGAGVMRRADEGRLDVAQRMQGMRKASTEGFLCCESQDSGPSPLKESILVWRGERGYTWRAIPQESFFPIKRSFQDC